MVMLTPFRTEKFVNEDDNTYAQLWYYETTVTDDELIEEHPYIRTNNLAGVKYRGSYTVVYLTEQL